MGETLAFLARTTMDAGPMNRELVTISGVLLTPWKCIGFAGTALFAGRWVVQWSASRKAGRVTMPPLFWYMSVSGSLMLLAYFIFGKNDAVGVLSNLLPAFVSGYNLWLDLRHRRAQAATAPEPGV